MYRQTRILPSFPSILRSLERKIGTSIRTLTWLQIAQLNLLPLVRTGGGGLLDGRPAKQVVEPLLVGRVRHQDEDGEEGERHDGLPQVHVVLGVPLEDDEEPEVGKDGERCGNGEHDDLVDAANLAFGDAGDAHCGDGEQIKGGRAHNGTRAELSGLEVVEADLDAREQDLGCRRAQRHQSQVGHGAVPYGHLYLLGFVGS